jgi:4-hydroxy 2-oxovalerate aldolase
MIVTIINKLKSRLSRKRIEKPCLYCPPYNDIHKGMDFLVFGSGPSIEKERDLINKFIFSHSLITIGTNNVSKLYDLDYHGFSNRKRFVENAKYIDKNSKSILSPYFTKTLIKRHYKGDYYPLMYVKSNNRFDIQDGVIQCSCGTSGVLLIAVAIIMGAKNIFLAGFDGYSDYKSKKEKINCLDVKPKFDSYEKNVQHYMRLQKLNEYYLKEIKGYLLSKNKSHLKIITPTVFEDFYDSEILTGL